MINAEIISIGDELLNGQTVNTNASWLGQKLASNGINTRFVSTIADNKNDILQSLDLAINRTDIVFITGGLGPTKDDITKHTLSEYFDTELEENTEALTRLQNYYKSRNRELNELNKTQALLPKKCIPILNEIGTASGMWFEFKGKIIISMPGVPREMKKMMLDTILPKIKGSLNLSKIDYHFIKTVGIPESNLAILLNEWENALPKELGLAYLPSLGMVKLRLTKKGIISDSKINSIIEDAKIIINKYIYSYSENETFEESIGRQLLLEKSSLSTAESCTGGYLAHLITKVAGCSQYYQGSVVSYANGIKEQELKIPQDVLTQHGAVSEEVVSLMAKNCKEKFKTTYALATSGIAGPDGGSASKPVGTIWIAIAYQDKVETKLLHLNQPRIDNIHIAAIACLNLLRQTINKQLR